MRGDCHGLFRLAPQRADAYLLKGVLHDRAARILENIRIAMGDKRNSRSKGECVPLLAMLEAAAGRAQRAAWLYGAGEAPEDGQPTR